MIEVGFLGSVMLLAKRQQPVLDHAGSQLVEAPDVVDGKLHPVGDGLEQLVVVDLPAQPMAHHPGDRAAARAGLAADGDVLEPSHGAGCVLWLAILLAPSEEPADHGPRPVPQAAGPSVLGFGCRARQRSPTPTWAGLLPRRLSSTSV